jgi:hypothetical protein
MSLRSRDFLYVESPEPHRDRTKAILKQRPEIRGLISLKLRTSGNLARSMGPQEEEMTARRVHRSTVGPGCGGAGVKPGYWPVRVSTRRTGGSALSILARSGSSQEGSLRWVPSSAGSSSTVNPGGSVAISNRTSPGSRKYID